MYIVKLTVYPDGKDGIILPNVYLCGGDDSSMNLTGIINNATAWKTMDNANQAVHRASKMYGFADGMFEIIHLSKIINVDRMCEVLRKNIN